MKVQVKYHYYDLLQECRTDRRKGWIHTLSPTHLVTSSAIKSWEWQFCVEIEDYSVAYFNCIVVFEAPYCWTSIKGGAHTCFVDAWISSNKPTKCIWAPPLTEVQQYGALNAAMWSKYTTEYLGFQRGTATSVIISTHRHWSCGWGGRGWWEEVVLGGCRPHFYMWGLPKIGKIQN